MPGNLRKDKYQLVVFVGDISTEEGNVVSELWKHLDKQIATHSSVSSVESGLLEKVETRATAIMDQEGI
jgi:hypothetical protein